MGVDCGGLLGEAGKGVGITGYDNKDWKQYPRVSRRHQFVQDLENTKLVRVPLDEWIPADVLVFWVGKHNRIPQHAGWGTDVGLLHVEGEGARGGYVVETAIDDYWQQRLVAAFRLPELDPVWHGITPEMLEPPYQPPIPDGLKPEVQLNNCKEC